MKPAKNDNSWLGVMGETMCGLFDKNGKLVGTTIHTPNAIAYAMGLHSNIVEARNKVWRFPETITKRKDIENRIWFAIENKNLGQHLKMIRS